MTYFTSTSEIRLTDFFIILIFVAGIFTPLLGGIILDQNKTSAAEKRQLNPLPDMPRSIKEIRRYPENFNLYYQDYFGFRAFFLHAYSTAKLSIGDSPSEKVIIGKDGWLFYRGIPDDDLVNATRGIRKYKDSELKQYADVLQARYDWLERRGIKYVFVIAPNKHSIYREYLPDYMFQVKPETITDAFIEYMQQHTSVPIIDLRQTLLEHKEPGTFLYFPTDTHWNHFGSSIAQYEIAKNLAEYFPDQITPVDYDHSSFKVRTGTGGDLAIFIGQKDMFTEDYPRPRLDPCTRRPRPVDGNLQETFSTNCGKSELSAVIFRDSFFTWLHPYISLYFNRATYVGESLRFSNLKKFVEREKPDLVIEEMAERTLTRIPQLEMEYRNR